MMKVVILAVLGLLVGIGGGSATAVLKARKAFAAGAAVRARVVADSLAKVEEEGAAARSPADTTADSSAPAAAEPQVAAGAGAKPGAAHPAKGAPAPSGATREAPAASSRGEKWDRAVATVESRGTPTAAGSAAPRLPSLPPKPAALAVPPATARVAKIFAAMPAKEAAKVMMQLDDDDVQAIIGSVSEKQAAAILQNFAPERAAAISKAVMRSAADKP